MKTLLSLVLLTASAGLMQASITESISIDLSTLHAGSTLSGMFVLPDVVTSGMTAPVTLSFSDPADYTPTTLSATISIGDGTTLTYTVRFSDLAFTNPTGVASLKNINLHVAGAAQCASFPCSASGRFQDGDPAAFSGTYTIGPVAAAAVPEPACGLLVAPVLLGLALVRRRLKK